ncbi:hypothetical protein [Halospeciosus flavus]|uniref:DUF3784 domain-containing protein n=1 Tax=Halospeciosus flavus TaxID=3032283 RepID=A0ABD5Z963_9EURY|nr:hypothetical protein [Halospeciosus flavus]
MNESTVAGLVLLVTGLLVAGLGFLVRYRGRTDLLTAFSQRAADDPAAFGRVTGLLAILYGAFVAAVGVATAVLQLSESATGGPVVAVTVVVALLFAYAHWRY